MAGSRSGIASSSSPPRDIAIEVVPRSSSQAGQSSNATERDTGGSNATERDTGGSNATERDTGSQTHAS
eukprot:16441831-Heterocapsa_arctica.AAC.1